MIFDMSYAYSDGGLLFDGDGEPYDPVFVAYMNRDEMAVNYGISPSSATNVSDMDPVTYNIGEMAIIARGKAQERIQRRNQIRGAMKNV